MRRTSAKEVREGPGRARPSPALADLGRGRSPPPVPGSARSRPPEGDGMDAHSRRPRVTRRWRGPPAPWVRARAHARWLQWTLAVTPREVWRRAPRPRLRAFLSSTRNEPGARAGVTAPPADRAARPLSLGRTLAK